MSDHYSRDEGGHFECRRSGDCACKCSVCRASNIQSAQEQIRYFQEQIDHLQEEIKAAQFPPYEARRLDVRQIYNDIWTEMAPADCTWLGPKGKQRLTILQSISTEEGRLAYIDASTPPRP